MAFIGAAVIGGAVLLAAGGGEDDGPDANAAAVALPQSLTKQDAGIEARYPEGWKRSERAGIVTLESGDRCVALSLSAPVDSSAAGRLFNDSLESLRRSFGNLELRRPRPAPLVGGHPTETAIAAVRNKQSRPVAVQISVSRGPRLAHLMQLVVRDPSCRETLQESRAVLASILYTR